jgi:hypothetical protein
MTKPITTLLTREQIEKSKAAYPKDDSLYGTQMREFHDKLCDMALRYLDEVVDVPHPDERDIPW